MENPLFVDHTHLALSLYWAKENTHSGQLVVKLKEGQSKSTLYTHLDEAVVSEKENALKEGFEEDDWGAEDIVQFLIKKGYDIRDLELVEYTL